MAFTNFFIERPVFATVVNIIIFLVGVVSIASIELRQYPDIKRNTVTITTNYYGADEDLIKGFITDPISRALAGVDGVDYIYSSSMPSQSLITVQLAIGVDDNIAFNDVQANVNSVKANLPSDAQEPIIEKVSSASSTAAMYIAFKDSSLTATQLYEFVNRQIVPRIVALPEVDQLTPSGASEPAMRIRLKPKEMALHGVAAEDVMTALNDNNYLSASGYLKTNLIQIFSTPTTSISTPEEFKRIAVSSSTGGSPVYLEDVADVEYGAYNEEQIAKFNGEQGIVLPIFNTPNSNVITVMQRVKDEMEDIKKSLPASMTSFIVYDSTISMQESIDEVVNTIFEASAIVIFIIFLFLGSLRSTLIPIVTIPLSLAGACIGIMMFGYSINLLTLLALVLAIGLVVDDAIVVIENIQRHMEEGMPVLESSKLGASSIIGSIIAMTITLAAVFTPLGFSSGITGALFKEFAFTLAFAVIVSGIVSLILSPMMCSKILCESSIHGKFVTIINKFFDKIRFGYDKILTVLFNQKWIVLIIPIIILDVLVVLFGIPAVELVPQEYNGFVFAQGYGPSSASFNYMKFYTDLLDQSAKKIDGVETFFSNPNMMGPTMSFTGLALTPWTDRPDITDRDVMVKMMQYSNTVPGVKYQVLMSPSLPIMKSMVNQLVIKSPEQPEKIFQVAEKIRAEAMKTGRFLFVDSDLKIDQIKYRIKLDRKRMSQLGISAKNVGNALGLLLSSANITQFNFDQMSYDVMPESISGSRIDIDDLKAYPIQLSSEMASLHFHVDDFTSTYKSTIPLSEIATITQEVGPLSYPQFQQLNSATLSYLPVDVKDTTVLDVFKDLQAKYMPANMSYDYADQLRFSVNAGNETTFVFIGALVFIYLILSATFESFRHPLIIMMTIPLATLGAFIPMALGWSSFNMYTQIAIVTLMGLITKHGILIVDFANQLLPESKDENEAAKKSAGLRLRPILMTTLAMVLGALPLVFAQGPGAFSRFDLGILIVYGMSVGTFFSLFVIPVLYASLTNFKRLLSYLGVLLGQAALFAYVYGLVTG